MKTIKEGIEPQNVSIKEDKTILSTNKADKIDEN